MRQSSIGTRVWVGFVSSTRTAHWWDVLPVACFHIQFVWLISSRRNRINLRCSLSGASIIDCSVIFTPLLVWYPLGGNSINQRNCHRLPTITMHAFYKLERNNTNLSTPYSYTFFPFPGMMSSNIFLIQTYPSCQLSSKTLASCSRRRSKFSFDPIPTGPYPGPSCNSRCTVLNCRCCDGLNELGLGLLFKESRQVTVKFPCAWPLCSYVPLHVHCDEVSTSSILAGILFPPRAAPIKPPTMVPVI